MRTALVLALLAGALAHAQTTTTLFGTITDKSGAAVPTARFTAVNTGTNQTWTAQTNSQGEYRIEFLPVGDYAVEISADGFKKAVQKGVTLQVSVAARADAQLDIGPLTESVEVAAAAPTVNTEDAQIGRTVENTEITTLPIVGRNVYTLLTLTPGVSSSSNSIVLGYPEQRTMINGGVDGGAGSVNYYLDGGNNMTGLRNTGNAIFAVGPAASAATKIESDAARGRPAHAIPPANGITALMLMAIDWSNETWRDIAKVLFSYGLALPVGWHREKEEHSVGVRTFPLVAMASCAYILAASPIGHFSIDAQSRVLQGLLAGIGFIGGGAILKSEGTVHGAATAASIFSTGVVGAAVATDRYWLAVLLAILNLLTLRILWPVKQKLDRGTNDPPPGG
ncbi:MAG TPA: MgtC/SapB family protein [Bryobacteraceae bacterium]|nr:MgtC/SapB family protein [Bryobacteraceae bacterium]